jgi:hypothetical protein
MNEQQPKEYDGNMIFAKLKQIDEEAGDLIEVDRFLHLLIKGIEDGAYSRPHPAPAKSPCASCTDPNQCYVPCAPAPASDILAPTVLPENYWSCPFRKGCEDGESWCSWPCDKWAHWHDAIIRQQERDKVLDELKKDLQTRFVSSSNSWSKGRNSGLIECDNIIDEHRQSTATPGSSEARK